MARVTISLPDEVLARVDAVRGLVPRSAWIQNLVAQHGQRSQGPVAAPRSGVMTSAQAKAGVKLGDKEPKR